MIFPLFWEGAFIRRGAFIRGGVYFKIRDFRGTLIRGGVYSRRGVYSRKYGIPDICAFALHSAFIPNSRNYQTCSLL